MQLPRWSGAGRLWLLAVLLASGATHALEVGDLAPDFTLQGSDGRTYRLSDFRGDRTVVLAWYPRAFTRGCTIECRSLAQDGHLIREYEVVYFMASVDPLQENAAFAEAEGADFPLLSDPDKGVARDYGVLSEGGFAKRETFYIGTDGRILAIDRQVQPETAAPDIAARLAALNVARR